MGRTCGRPCGTATLCTTRGDLIPTRAQMTERPPHSGMAFLLRVVRRRPTLPQPLGCSTIGAERLNFRVRYGSGCFPFAVAAVTLLSPCVFPRTCLVGVWGQFVWTRVCFVVVLRVCVASPRPISTGRLGIAAVYLRPINPIVCGGPYQVDPVGNFILKCASRLDAFSGYHVRT